MVPSPKIRVLVVDDDANLGRSIIAHLVRRGLEVSSAASGEEAHRMFRVYDPGLVLLDLSSSGADALDTLERLKRIKPDVAVILLSSENSPEVIFSASKLGADDYLSKPFELKDLDLRINKILDKQRPTVGSRAAPRSGAAQRRFRRPVRNQSEDGRGERHHRAGG